VCTEQWRADREAAGVCRCPYFHDVVSLESAAGVDCEAWGQRNGYGAGRDIACRETDSKACMTGKGERERESTSHDKSLPQETIKVARTGMDILRAVPTSEIVSVSAVKRRVRRSGIDK
jgi:hypothetical protein